MMIDSQLLYKTMQNEIFFNIKTSSNLNLISNEISAFFLISSTKLQAKVRLNEFHVLSRLTTCDRANVMS